MATKPQNVSQATNWPYIQKANFMNEDKTVMKIVKFISSVIILPLAFLMDLVKKAHDYVWPKKIEPVTSKKCCWTETIKNGANAALTKVQNFWADHKKAILISSSVATAGLLGWNFLPFAAMKTAFCNKTSIC